MAYKITDKGKYVIKNHPDLYKKLLQNIKKEKVDVIEISGDYKGKPMAKIEVFEINLYKSKSDNSTTIGHAYSRSSASAIASVLRKQLKQNDRVAISVSNAYIYSE